ncbi:MAG: response regulator transcription factor [Piscinibacter sp.]|nr:response regulator transcription factor [Piscinibacter sp.]
MRIAALWTPPATDSDTLGAFEARAIPVEQFSAPDALLHAWREKAFDAILVLDGGAASRPWLERLQAQTAARVPIIVVGAGDAASIAQALMSGADDYATDAEGAAGLVQRVLGRVRARAAARARQHLHVGVYSLDVVQRTLAAPGHEVRLTARECQLLRVLFERPGRITPAETLSAAVHERAEAGNRRSIEQHVYKLRRKCRRVSMQQATPLSIESVYASGYRLKG